MWPPIFTGPQGLSCWWKNWSQVSERSEARCSPWRVQDKCGYRHSQDNMSGCLRKSSGQISVLKKFKNIKYFHPNAEEEFFKSSDIVICVTNSYLGSSNVGGKGGTVHAVPVRAGI